MTGAEQCDGGSFCNKCMCLTGYKPTSPLSQSCELIPVEFVPRVVPSLDCVDFLDTGVAQLYFSYDNLDGFEQTIEHGKHNDFTPESIAVSFMNVAILSILTRRCRPRDQRSSLQGKV